MGTFIDSTTADRTTDDEPRAADRTTPTGRPPRPTRVWTSQTRSSIWSVAGRS